MPIIYLDPKDRRTKALLQRTGYTYRRRPKPSYHPFDLLYFFVWTIVGAILT